MRKYFLCSSLPLLIVIAGCNTSLYHRDHDYQLPGIRTVAIVPLDIQMAARHTGGTLERRVDVEEKVTPSLIKSLSRLVEKRGREPIACPIATSQPAEPDNAAALPGAVVRVIGDLYYSKRITAPFDYIIENRFVTPDGRKPDALLFVRMNGVFPTGGRIGLKVTAIVVGGLIGNSMVKMSETHLSLMLVNANTGEVLWYNQGQKGENARERDDLDSIVKHVGKYLLKPQKN